MIRAGTLRWIDEARTAEPLALADVELVVRNGLRDHDVRLDATPPPGWGDRFSVRGRFDQPLFSRSSDWRRWSGQVYADLPRAELSELRRHVTLPFELSEGDGALRGWFELKDGLPTSASVDLALRAVALRLDKAVEPLDFEQVAGRIDAEKSDDRTSIAVRQLGFRTGDGLSWPQGDMRVAWRQDEAGAVTGGEFDAERLDVGVMAEIATRVPIGAALRELLADVRPRGVITQLRTRWDGPLDAPLRYRVKGQLSGLSLAAHPSPDADSIGRPGLSNASLQLEATEAGGQARIDIRSGRLDLPGVFEEREVPLDRLDAQAQLEGRSRRQRRGAEAERQGGVGELRQRRRQGRPDRDVALGPRQRRRPRRPLPGPARARRQAHRRRRRAHGALPAARPAARRAQLRRRRGARRDDRERDLPRPRRSLGLPVPRRRRWRATATSASPPRSRA